MMKSALCKAVFKREPAVGESRKTGALRCSFGAGGKKTKRRLDPFREGCVSAVGNLSVSPKSGICRKAGAI